MHSSWPRAVTAARNQAFGGQGPLTPIPYRGPPEMRNTGFRMA